MWKMHIVAECWSTREVAVQELGLQIQKLIVANAKEVSVSKWCLQEPPSGIADRLAESDLAPRPCSAIYQLCVAPFRRASPVHCAGAEQAHQRDGEC